MKAVEFEGTITEAGQISLPPEVAAEIPAGEHLRVVVLWDSSGPNSAWREAGRRSFEAAYGPDDNIYERLLNDPSTR